MGAFLRTCLDGWEFSFLRCFQAVWMARPAAAEIGRINSQLTQIETVAGTGAKGPVGRAFCQEAKIHSLYNVYSIVYIYEGNHPNTTLIVK